VDENNYYDIIAICIKEPLNGEFQYWNVRRYKDDFMIQHMMGHHIGKWVHYSYNMMASIHEPNTKDLYDFFTDEKEFLIWKIKHA
jgi:hypothetical protein